MEGDPRKLTPEEREKLQNIKEDSISRMHCMMDYLTKDLPDAEADTARQTILVCKRTIEKIDKALK